MTPFRSVVAYAGQDVNVIGLGVISMIFADRTHLGLPAFDFTVCADEPGPLRTDLGLSLNVGHGPERMTEADLVVLLPSNQRPLTLRPDVIEAILTAYQRGAIISSFCTGSFLLGCTGLLDGRRATTHWSLADDLAAKYPRVKVEAGALYIDEGRIVTGAGDAAGIDMCLHLLRREHGGAVANAIARESVTAPHREGGQAQYIPAPIPPDGDDEQLVGVMEWIRANLGKPLTVNDLAAHALMSPRTFARRFKAATGTTPQAWIRSQRLLRAEELLETTNLRIEDIARDVGFGSVAVLREQIVKRRGVSPRAYRRTFSRR